MVIITQIISHHSGMLDVSTESQRLQLLVSHSMLLYLLVDKLAVFRCRDLRNQTAFARCCQPIINQFVTNTIIVERHNQIIDDGITKPQLVWDIIAENLYHILIIHSVLGSCQAQQELRLKIVDDFPITVCYSMVTLIDDDIIEFLLIKEFERTAHRNIGREQEILTCFLCLRIIQTAGFRATKDLLECLQGFLQDRAFMYDVEQSVGIEIECIECCQIRLS